MSTRPYSKTLHGFKQMGPRVELAWKYMEVKVEAVSTNGLTLSVAHLQISKAPLELVMHV